MAGQRENVYEMIAMYLTALPVPPLPVWVRMQKKSEEEGVREDLTSSHDLLAGLLVMAMGRDRADLNKTRMERQQAIVEEFVKGLDGVDDVGAYYAACVKFTGGFVHAFADPQQPTPQVRFGELEQVAAGDKVHAACAHWMAAQDMLHQPDKTKHQTAAQYATLPYAALLRTRLGGR